jgi:hypothetical protein
MKKYGNIFDEDIRCADQNKRQGMYYMHQQYLTWKMKQTALKRDEEQVQAIVNHLHETMTDSFDIEAHPPCLMNISTGMHATREVQDSLLSAVNVFNCDFEIGL